MRFALFIALVPAFGPFVAAPTADDTQLKQVIIFGRHAVRTPNAPNSVLGNFSALEYPNFAVPGLVVITPNGQTNEIILGRYFRLWLNQEKLLTGNDAADAAFVYVRADNTPLIVDTAQAFAKGMLPGATILINTTSASDPLFDPVGAGVEELNDRMAVAAVNGAAWRQSTVPVHRLCR